MRHVPITRQGHLAVAVMVVLAVCSEARVAQASDEDENLPTWIDLAGPPDPADWAIQRRKFELIHEIAVLGGVLPVDPYYKGYTATVGYTLHFNNYVAWEIGSFTYAYDVDTNLKTQFIRILASLGQGGPTLPQINWWLASHLVIKPFYGKQAFYDETLVHLEGFAQIGPALMGLQKLGSNLTGSADSLYTRSVGPGLDFGIGIRVFLTDLFSVRIEAGDVVFPLDGNIWQSLHLQGGIAFNLGGDA